MASFLHTADLHLGQAGGEALPQEIARGRQREITGSLERIVDLALAKDVDLLLIAGDLFTDKFTSPALVRYANHQFSRLGNKKVLVSAGNHDPLLPDSPAQLFSWHQNVHFFPPSRWQQCSFPELGVAVTGLSWGREPPQEGLLSQMPSPVPGLVNIALLHGSAGEAASLATEYFPLPAAAIANMGYHYLALGHYHSPACWQEGDTICAYAGSPEPLSFAEEGSHGLWLGSTTPQLGLEFVPLGKRAYVTLNWDLTGITCEGELVAKLREALQDRNPDLVRLVLTGTLPSGFQLDLETIGAELQEMVYFLKILDQTQEEVPLSDFPPGSLRQLFAQQICAEFEQTEAPERRKMLNLALHFGLVALSTGKVQVGEEG